jgi:hypothetical protein
VREERLCTVSKTVTGRHRNHGDRNVFAIDTGPQIDGSQFQKPVMQCAVLCAGCGLSALIVCPDSNSLYRRNE